MDIQVIEAIFKKLSMTYGKAFLDQYRDMNIQEVMENWAHELSGFSTSPHAVAYAMECLPSDKPPNVLQFWSLCRQAPPPFYQRLEMTIDKTKGLEQVAKLKQIIRPRNLEGEF